MNGADDVVMPAVSPRLVLPFRRSAACAVVLLSVQEYWGRAIIGIGAAMDGTSYGKILHPRRMPDVSSLIEAGCSWQDVLDAADADKHIRKLLNRLEGKPIILWSQTETELLEGIASDIRPRPAIYNLRTLMWKSGWGTLKTDFYNVCRGSGFPVAPESIPEEVAARARQKAELILGFMDFCMKPDDQLSLF